MKYRNVPKRYGNRTYQSTLEARYAQQLDLMQKAGEIQSWAPQPRYTLHVNGHLICTIIPDFHVIGKHGREEIHETKSWATQTPEWRVKWKLFKALFPELHTQIIMDKDVMK